MPSSLFVFVLVRGKGKVVAEDSKAQRLPRNSVRFPGLIRNLCVATEEDTCPVVTLHFREVDCIMGFLMRPDN